MSAKDVITDLIKQSGITINGNKPGDITIRNEEFYSRVVKHGSLGLGESYMDEWWDCDHLDAFFNKLLRARLQKSFRLNRHNAAVISKAFLFNMANKRRSKKVAEEHYDLGNEFYEDMLGKYMQYTCAYWKKARTLDTAQRDKLDLICKKLQLKKGDRVLELGSGFGGFAHFAAKNYGVHVTSYNISKEQVAFANKINKGLSVTTHLQDYREATGMFDKVVSIGLCEHVGHKNYRVLMELAHKCMKDDGLFLLHTIGGNVTKLGTDPWINKYIFPNGMLPSVQQLSTAFQGLFVMEDWHNFGPDYDKTLMGWYANFTKHWDAYKQQYGKRFFRMWSYYLLACAGAFRAREIQLWQIVFSKQSGVDRYVPVR